jgi:cell division protein FtsW
MSFDRNLLFLIIELVAIGLIAIADVSTPQSLNNYGDKFYLLKEQAVSAAIGIVAFFVISRIKYTFWEKIATPVFFISVFFLILVLGQKFGLSLMGASRWLRIGSVNFQPSEAVKLTLCIYFAKVASSGKSHWAYFIPLAVVAGLVMLQPDLGTTLVLLIIGFSQIFVSGVNLVYFLGFGAFGAAGTIILILTSPYRKARLTTFFETTSDPLGGSYHIRQILLALGSGGIFGTGLGSSIQKYSFLPEASTDSIFAVIAEEVGLIGALGIITLFLLLVLRGLKIAKSAPDKFSSMLATGVSA